MFDPNSREAKEADDFNRRNFLNPVWVARSFIGWTFPGFFFRIALYGTLYLTAGGGLITQLQRQADPVAPPVQLEKVCTDSLNEVGCK
jgi:hypothetical protein